MGQTVPQHQNINAFIRFGNRGTDQKTCHQHLAHMPKGPYEKGKFTIRPNCFMTSPIISLSNVHLSLESNAGTVEILKNISLDVSAGESLGLIGPSGSGKSSLLMLLGGLERASSGMVNVSGTDLSRQSEDQLALLRRDQMGIVFQSFHLIPTMTALENVATPLELAGVRDAFHKAQEAWMLWALHRHDHYPAQLSG